MRGCAKKQNKNKKKPDIHKKWRIAEESIALRENKIATYQKISEHYPEL